MAIAGFVNVPIIKFSVDWWASLAPTVFSQNVFKETTIHSTRCLTPLLYHDCGICSILSINFFNEI